jgi:asparagine synthase (glutamine-hydrolysing)
MHPHADRQAQHVRKRIEALGWHVRIDHPGWVVAEATPPAEHCARATADERIVVIGPLFARSATHDGQVDAFHIPRHVDDMSDFCGLLTRHAWGAYVALACNRDGSAALAVFRDPMGMLDCASWESASVRLVSSAPNLFISSAPPRDLSVDWRRLRTLLAYPGLVGEASPLAGVDVVEPGTLVFYGAHRRRIQRLWSASRAAAPNTMPSSSSARYTPGELAAVVDASIAAWCSCAENAVGELSGGLDSAIVAAGVQTLAAPPVAQWFHYSSCDRAGDERAFARSVAHGLGLPMTEIVRDPVVLDAAGIEAIPVGWRPGLGSTSLFHDADLAERSAVIGADTLLTGHGGDAVFFQPPTNLVAADLADDPRAVSAKLSTALDIAAWTQSSIWSVLGAAAHARWRRRPWRIPMRDTPFALSEAPLDGCASSWLMGSGRLPPAKQMQIWAIANSRSAFGTSWCTQRMNVFHPLLSQPVVEHVLAIPTLGLTEGRRDRMLARRAYAERLPADLLARRGKGRLTAWFGQMLAASTATIRPYLLDGQLASHKVLDRDRLEQVLHADRLMQDGPYGAILTALFLERWARAWTERIGIPPTDIAR